MALARNALDSNLFGVPSPPQQNYFQPAQLDQQQQQQQPAGFGGGSFGDTAPLGGTPTVPPTAQAVAPSALAAPQQPFMPILASADANVEPMPQEQQQQQPAAPPTYQDFLRDYWAPDRDAVLQSMMGGGSSVSVPSGGTGFENGGVAGGAQLPGSTSAPTAGAPAPNNSSLYGNMQSFGQAWLASGGRTNADLAAFVQAHPEYGVTLGGSTRNKVYGPNGQYWAQATQSGHLGGVAGTWDTSTGGGGSAGGSGAMNGSIDNAIMSLLNGGSTPFGNQMQQLLTSILGGHGQTPNLTNQLQSARTDAARSMNAQLGDADAALAARGLASTPGVSQGPMIGATERVAEGVGANYAAALRDIESHGLDLAHATEIQALSLATGLSESQAQNILGAIGQGTTRQGTLANIALQQLAQNQSWNQFLLGYGLDQQRLAEDISQGRIGNVIQLLQLFLQGAGTSAGGHY